MQEKKSSIAAENTGKGCGLIIYDFDGVIADSEVLANAVLAEFLTELGTPTTLQDSYRLYMGKRWADAIAAAAGIRTNLRVMHRHYGTKPRLWLGIKVKLYAGETQYDGKPQKSVLLAPVSPDIPAEKRAAAEAEGKPTARAKGDVNRPIDDEIPF